MFPDMGFVQKDCFKQKLMTRFFKIVVKITVFFGYF